MKLTRGQTAGLVASAIIVGVAIAALRPNRDTGYVQIDTVPVAPVTRVPLYFDAVKLDPIRQGSALLRQPVGSWKLETSAFGDELAPLCNVVIRKNRITTVTISVLERPPRCVCKFTKTGDATNRTCVS